jgi:hypothetical protein
MMNAAQNTIAIACKAPPTANIYWNIMENPRYESKKNPKIANITNAIIATPGLPFSLS